MDVHNKRNVILLGHAQCGKTTLAESILFACKAVTRKGTTAEGSTVSDYSFDEIEHKSSINSSMLFCDYKGHRLQVVDSPGYADFYGEVISGVRAVDAGIVVVDASAGIQVGTERAWQMLEDQNEPCMFFINKTDKEGVDPREVLLELKTTFSKNCVMIESLEDPDLMEAIAESDDNLLQKYLEVLTLSQDEIKAGLTRAVVARKLFPVAAGSALADKGIAALIEDIIEYLPDPSARRAITVRVPGKDEEIKDIPCCKENFFAAFVFKNIVDPYVGQLTLLRVFSGTLASNTGFYNVNRGVRERIGQVYLLQGKDQKPVDVAQCGDIIAIAKLKETQTGDTLSDEKNQFLFDPLVFPEPAISASVKPKSREDEEKIAIALHKLVAEDPTCKVIHDPATKELVISGLGDQHLGVIVGRLRKRFHVEVDLGTPKVSYKETITKPARVQGKFKRQSGGRGQYGDCTIEIEPIERSGGFEFVDKIVGGAIPRNFIPSVEKGVRQAMVEGAIAGYPIVDIRVRLVDGSYHDVDSSDMAFQIAGGMALRKAVAAASPIILEPVMEADVTIPEDCLGAVTGDANSRRGRVIGMDQKGRSQQLKVSVPLSEMFTYANDLRSLTGGRGQYIMRFSHYEPVPHKIASGIISHYEANKKQEVEV